MPPLLVPALRSVLPDLAAFLLGLKCAQLLGWNVTSLVWSLWLSSLVVGYLTILSPFIQGLFVGALLVGNPQFPARMRGGAITAGLGGGLFLLAFMSFHFCAFHAGHASFLQSFFPLDGVPKNALGANFMNPIGLWKAAFTWIVPKFGIFLVPVLLSHRHSAFGWVGATVRTLGRASPDAPAAMLQAALSSKADSLARPYLNVARMHCLIFFFAFAHAMKLDSLPVFVVTYAVYFFPWSAFRADRHRSGAPAADQVEAPASSTATKQPSMRQEPSG